MAGEEVLEIIGGWVGGAHGSSKCVVGGCDMSRSVEGLNREATMEQEYRFRGLLSAGRISFPRFWNPYL